MHTTQRTSTGHSTFPYYGSEAGVISILPCAGAVSILAILSAAIYYLATLKKVARHRTNMPPYLISLLLACILQAVGTIINARWAVQGFVEVGRLCSAQAILKNASSVAIATWTLVIAAHVFNLLFLRWQATYFGLTATLLAGWSFVATIITIGPLAIQTDSNRPYFGIADYWCWITDEYPMERIFLEYFIEFLSAGLGFVLYTCTLLRCRGNLKVVNGKWRLHWISPKESWKLHAGRDMIDAAMLRAVSSMVWYPVVYSVLIIPMAFARLFSFTGKSVPFWATIFTEIIFNLAGLVISILFIFTRRLLPDTAVLPDFTTQRPELTIEHDVRSFGSEGRMSQESEVKMNSPTDGVTPYILPSK